MRLIDHNGLLDTVFVKVSGPGADEFFLFEVNLINDINVHGGAVHNEGNRKIFPQIGCVH